ncbi:MAG: C39 family peptidase [Bilifractor sp.]
MKNKYSFAALILACSLAATLTAGCGSASTASEAATVTRLKNVTGSSDTAELSDSGDDSDNADETWSVDTAKEDLTEILSSDLDDDSTVLDVPEMFQNPELPTGCESVALTIALNALGCSLNKTDIAEQYLEYGDNLAYQYAGDPHTDSGAGVFAAGIVNAAEKYIDDQNLEIAAFNTTGTSLADLYKVVDAGYPVVIWGTMYMSDPMMTSQTYEYNGLSYTWYQNEHCMVLCGYDEDSNTVVVSDPLSGIVVRDASQYESYFNEIGQYSVVLMNENGVQKTTLDTSKADAGDNDGSSTENYEDILEHRQDTSSHYYDQWQNNGNSSGTYYNNTSASQGQYYYTPADSASGASQGSTDSSSSGGSQGGSGSASQGSQSGNGGSQDSGSGSSGGSDSGSSGSGASDTPSGGGGDNSGNSGGGSSGAYADDGSGGGSGSATDTPQTPGGAADDGGGSTAQTES